MKQIIFFLILLNFPIWTNAERQPGSMNSVLSIGDSQSEGYLGGIVYRYLKDVRKIGDVQVYGVSSSSPRHWADDQTTKNSQWLCSRAGRKNKSTRYQVGQKVCKGKTSQSAFEHLNTKKPDLVIFQFLGNSIGFNEVYIERKIKKLLSVLDESQECLFITSPPNHISLSKRNDKRLQTQGYFRSAVGKRCRFFAGVTKHSLTEFANDKKNFVGDKVHLSKKGAQSFFKSFQNFLP